ncbi:MAG TPA: prolipoprotein diacylglyceryl transferase family protein [Kofleriaceae bacterium]
MAADWLTGVVELGGDRAPGLLWGASLALGVAYAVRSARRVELDPRAAYWAAMLAVGCGLIGSRLLGMIVNGPDDDRSWSSLIDGGRSYYGGLLAGAAAALAYLRVRRQPVLRHADALAPACALGYCVGRIGCFFNGDDYGVVVSGAFPLAVRYPPGTEAYGAHLERGLISPADAMSLPVVPSQLGHAALGLILFLVLRRPRSVDGMRVASFALLYGIGRFTLEFARGEFAAVVGPMSLHQVISLGLIGAGAAVLIRAASRRGVGMVAPAGVETL